MLEILNLIISLSLSIILLMYASYLSRTDEYRKIMIISSKLQGDVSYSLNKVLRSLWTMFYRYSDRILGVESTKIDYFT